jgi:hypothetical protein
MQEENVTQKMNVQRQKESVEEIDVLQQEFERKCRTKKDASILWQKLQHEEKLGISNMKLTNKDEDKKVIEYIKSHKTKDVYAFSRKEISDATGIPLNILSYTTIVKIPTIRFILSDGKLMFTTVTLKERLMEFLKNR